VGNHFCSENYEVPKKNPFFAPKRHELHVFSHFAEEMKSFAKQWLNPVFSWDLMVFLVILCFASVVAVIAGLALNNWIVGVSFLAGVVLSIHIFLFVIWILSRKEE